MTAAISDIKWTLTNLCHRWYLSEMCSHRLKAWLVFKSCSAGTSEQFDPNRKQDTSSTAFNVWFLMHIPRKTLQTNWATEHTAYSDDDAHPSHRVISSIRLQYTHTHPHSPFKLGSYFYRIGYAIPVISSCDSLFHHGGMSKSCL